MLTISGINFAMLAALVVFLGSLGLAKFFWHLPGWIKRDKLKRENDKLVFNGGRK